MKVCRWPAQEASVITPVGGVYSAFLNRKMVLFPGNCSIYSELPCEKTLFLGFPTLVSGRHFKRVLEFRNLSLPFHGRVGLICTAADTKGLLI